MSIQLRELIAANCIVDGVHLTVRYPGSSRAEPSLNPKYFELSTDQQAHAYISYIIVSSMPSSKATPIKFIVSRYPPASCRMTRSLFRYFDRCRPPAPPRPCDGKQ